MLDEDWCQRNGLAEEALEYAIVVGDVDTVARLVQDLWTPTYRQGRFATLQRWFRWLDERGGMARHPGAALRRLGMETVLACAVQARIAMHRGDVPEARR